MTLGYGEAVNTSDFDSDTRRFKSYYPSQFNMAFRGVAQFGSATGLGPVGRGFKSCHPDHFFFFARIAQ